jgi:hypothetical protein
MSDKRMNCFPQFCSNCKNWVKLLSESKKCYKCKYENDDFCPPLVNGYYDYSPPNDGRMPSMFEKRIT